MNEEVKALIEGEVDGINSPNESARLVEFCASDPSIQMELDRSLEVAHILSQISPKEPSSIFHSSVMSSLPDHPSWMPRKSPAPSWTSFFKLPQRPSFVLAYGIVAGAIVMFALINTVSPTSEIPGDISATMAPAESILFSDDVSVANGEVITIDAQIIDHQIVLTIPDVLGSTADISLKIEDQGVIVFDKTFQPK